MSATDALQAIGRGTFAVLREMVEALQAAPHDSDAYEDALDRIYDDPLELLVRSDWYRPGDRPDVPDEYKILLSTGGPATQIVGTLDEYGEPTSARLQAQDWFLPWTDIELDHYEGPDGEDVDSEDTLLAYARCFFPS